MNEDSRLDLIVDTSISKEFISILNANEIDYTFQKIMENEKIKIDNIDIKLLNKTYIICNLNDSKLQFIINEIKLLINIFGGTYFIQNKID